MPSKLGSQGVFAMAVGGMIGGGIFSVLGVVTARAGRWAWVSFVIGGAVALATSFSYARLARRHGTGGLYSYLRGDAHDGVAGVAVVILLFGYVLTMSVYAFTFAHYLADVLGLGSLLTRLVAVAAVGTLLVVNLVGLRSAAGVEIGAVWGKLAILLALAVIGIWRWKPDNLDTATGGSGVVGVLVGAATVFMAYEGFQLLAYDYDDLQRPRLALARVVPFAVVVVTAIYVAVTLAASSLAGADTLVDQKEVALAVAGREAAGRAGLVLVTIAAVLSTASAINSTLFATARLAGTAGEHHDLPKAATHRTDAGQPAVALVTIAVAAAVLAASVGLASLVEAASLTFLVGFSAVNVLAALDGEDGRIVPAVAAAATLAAAVVLTVEIVVEQPLAAVILAAMLVGGVVTHAAMARRASAGGDRS